MGHEPAEAGPGGQPAGAEAMGRAQRHASRRQLRRPMGLVGAHRRSRARRGPAACLQAAGRGGSPWAQLSSRPLEEPWRRSATE